MEELSAEKQVVQELFDSLSERRPERWLDRVVARLRSAGRETSSFLGYEPSGKIVETKGVYIFTVRDGRIVEAWDVWDFLGRLVQIGAWPPPGHTI